MAFANTFDTISPTGSDDPSEADDRMREIKAATQERANVDHYWPLTGTGVSDDDAGEHRKVTIRTLSVVEVAALSATKAYLYRLVTDGELYFKDDSDNTIQLSDKGNNLANDNYLTGTDLAETGSVDLIKAGRNEADDADVVIIPDAARMASDAAPGEDTGIANKKFVVDTPHTGGIVQVVNTQTGALATGSTELPHDDTIPQNTEGDEYMTLAITPTNSNNKLKIDVVFHGARAFGDPVIVALFQDSIANALAASSDMETTAHKIHNIMFTHYMTARTTSAITFKVRAGTDSANIVTFNGYTNARKLGGVMASSITITEIKV